MWMALGACYLVTARVVSLCARKILKREDSRIEDESRACPILAGVLWPLLPLLFICGWIYEKVLHLTLRWG